MSDSRTLSVVAIDDDAQDAELLQRNLELVPRLEVDFKHVGDATDVKAELERGTVDVVFLDYELGSETGREVLERIRASGYLGPVIVMTGHGDEYLATELVRAGADDYVAKVDLDPERLRRAIRNGEAQHAQRLVGAQNRELVKELSATTLTLEDRNRRLSDLYRTAHQFVDDVSHEFRTPLTVVKDFASILRDGIAGEVNDEQKEYLGIIINRVDDLVTMVGDMLDISKIEAGKLCVSRRRVVVAELVEKTRVFLDRRAASGSIELVVDVPSDLPDVYCDAEKIGRVIMNLVVNAIKFSKRDQGRVVLWAKSAPESHEVSIGVTDNGPGIPKLSLAEIFERFQQVDGNFKESVKGYGLGLSISKQLVHLNLGRMSVESERGEGSTFSFTLPISEPVSLIERYLGFAGAGRDTAAFVSLISVTAASLGEGQSALVDGLLESETRHTDLLFCGEGRWLLVVGMSDRNARTVVDRLEDARDGWKERNPGGSLPSLRFRSLGTWRIGNRNDDFAKCFRSLWNGRDVSRAIVGFVSAQAGDEEPSIDGR